MDRDLGPQGHVVRAVWLCDYAQSPSRRQQYGWIARGVVSKCDVSVLKDLAASHLKAGKMSLIVNQSIDFVTAVGTAVASD